MSADERRLAHVHVVQPDGNWYFLGTVRGGDRVRVTLEGGAEVFVAVDGKVASSPSLNADSR